MFNIRTSLAAFGVFLLALQPWPTMAAEGVAAASVLPKNTEINPLANTLVLSAPPRGNLADETQNYQPIADFLSRVAGKKVVYQHSDNWLSYTSDMTKDKYDIVFDGPHFNGWRMDKLKHTPLVKLPEDFIFVVVAKADNASITDIKRLAGRRICAHAPPNLGTLTMLKQFDNPARQPLIVEVQGWDKSYNGLMEGKCVATVLPLKSLEKMDKGGNLTKVLYKSETLPNQAVSAGPRVTQETQDRIKKALLSEEGKAATAKLRAAYAGKDFIPATRDEYGGLGVYLKDALYYSN